MQSNAQGFWRDIPGYDGKYQASCDGEIRRVYPSGKTRILRPFKKKCVGKNPLVMLYHDEQHKRETLVHKAVAAAFQIRVPDGYVICHKDGIAANNAVDNLIVLSRKEMVQRYAHRQEGRKPVLKVDRDGNILATYRSINEAARQNYVSLGTVYKRVRKLVKHPFRETDYTFILDE